MKKPLITTGMRGWTACIGDAPRLQYQGKRAYFPHIDVGGLQSEIVINAGGHSLETHDDHARLMAAAPGLLVELALAWRVVESARQALHAAQTGGANQAALAAQSHRILQAVAAARGMTTDEAAAAIRALKIAN